MANEEILNDEQIETPEVDEYINKLEDYKTNYVHKNDYAKVKAENTKLRDALLKGAEYHSAEEAQQTRPSNEVWKDLFDNEKPLSNIEVANLALEYRDSILAEGGPDMFEGFGLRYNGEGNDAASAALTAEALQSCIDYAEGDSSIFTNELQRILVDTVPTINSRASGRGKHATRK